MFTWIVDKILQARDHRVKVNVLVHLAYFKQSPEPYYFIKVVNLSLNSNFTITHVWFENDNGVVHVFNSQRPLPHKLEPSDIWETWILKEGRGSDSNGFSKFRVMLSDGQTVTSRKNKNVPSEGYVA